MSSPSLLQSSSNSLHTGRQALRACGCGAALGSGLGNSSPPICAAESKDKSKDKKCGELECYVEEKDIEDLLIPKTALRKAIKCGNEAYVLLV